MQNILHKNYLNYKGFNHIFKKSEFKMEMSVEKKITLY